MYLFTSYIRECGVLLHHYYYGVVLAVGSTSVSVYYNTSRYIIVPHHTY